MLHLYSLQNEQQITMEKKENFIQSKQSLFNLPIAAILPNCSNAILCSEVARRILNH